MFSRYNFNPINVGDHLQLPPMAAEVAQAEPITEARLRFQKRGAPASVLLLSTEGEGGSLPITISDEDTWAIDFGAHAASAHSLTAGVWNYRLWVKRASGIIETLAIGTMEVTDA